MRILVTARHGFIGNKLRSLFGNEKRYYLLMAIGRIKNLKRKQRDESIINLCVN